MDRRNSHNKIIIAGADSRFLLSACQLLDNRYPSAVFVQHPQAAISAIQETEPALLLADDRLFDENINPDFRPVFRLAARQGIKVVAVAGSQAVQEAISHHSAVAAPVAVMQGLPVERRAGFSSLEQILNTLPFMAFVLEHDRTVVFSNLKAQKMFNSGNEPRKGIRPGEFLGCMHIHDGMHGCGSSAACSFCGLFKAITESLQTGRKAEAEARLIVDGSGIPVALNVQAEVSRLFINNKEMLVLYLEDISDQKRRRELERIFFHDLINTAGGIKSLIEAVSADDEPAEIRDILAIIGSSAAQMLEEIRSQKELTAAEHNELQVNPVRLDGIQLINAVFGMYNYHQVAAGKKIVIENNGCPVEFISDEVLIKRVLGNLLKNALEASQRGDEVKIGCRVDDGRILFTVHNRQFMPLENQYQIFQRSFSTKGANRGIGTYSIKLLTERYLGGLAFFTSSENEGTIFTIQLPLNQEIAEK